MTPRLLGRLKHFLRPALYTGLISLRPSLSDIKSNRGFQA